MPSFSRAIYAELLLRKIGIELTVDLVDVLFGQTKIPRFVSLEVLSYVYRRIY